MPRAAKVKANGQAPDDLPTILPEDLELADLVKQFPGAKRVTVGRYNPTTDRWAHMGSVPSDVFSEDMIQRRWGAGLYQARFRDERGAIIHTIGTIEIAADPDRPAVTAPDVNPAQPLGHGTNGNGAPAEMFMGMILSELKSNREMMLEMIRSFGERPQAQQTDLVTMVTALGSLQGLLPKQTTPLPERIVEKLLEGAIAQKNGTPQNEWIGLVKDVLVEFKPAIRAALVQKGVPARPATGALPARTETAGAAEPEEEETTVDGTGPAIEWLKSQCANGVKPATLPPVVLHFVDVKQIDLLLAKTDLVIFAELADPELDEPSARAWFEALFKELRAVRNIPNPNRPPGDAPNVDENVGTGA